jgi:hypothetical protein
MGKQAVKRCSVPVQRIDGRSLRYQQLKYCTAVKLPTQLRPVKRVLATISKLQPTQLVKRSRNGRENSSVQKHAKSWDGQVHAEHGEVLGDINPTLRQTCSRPKPRAQYAFKDLMIHGILQFTLRIAFRCVLHRYESQDIRC